MKAKKNTKVVSHEAHEGHKGHEEWFGICLRRPSEYNSIAISLRRLDDPMFLVYASSGLNNIYDVSKLNAWLKKYKL